ncbi:MAG TPA: phosphate acyltransferase PlsX [Planctomycetota bacterium]|nr:phosphate acyltransferase PlsX [Planctomycetota bacterium]
MVEIALDAMGGDHAPREIVRGALRAVESEWIRRDELILVGHRDRIADELREAGADPASFRVEHASEIVGMDESPLDALRKKRDSSISVATELVRNKQAVAVVSAGHTGAAVACAKLRLGTLEGIRRPGIAVAFDTLKGPAVLLDVGANVECKPVHLFQYGVMGHAYARDVLGVAQPRVALLNIGEEEEKGSRALREAHDLLSSSGLPFVGNVEGQDVFRGKADVLVCDGLVGNVVLKTSEGAADFLLELFRRELAASLAPDALKSALRSVAARLDYAEHGGALLLGIEGIVVIGHGRSDARAAASMLRVARCYVAADVNRHIVAALQRPKLGASKAS